MSNAFTSRYVPGVIPKIQLTPEEAQIIEVLNNYTELYNSQNTEAPITLRITGGWVRDKLLEHPSHDIDIGIDNCSGESFVTGLKEWMESTHDDPKSTNMHKIHKIKKNPDKSKHLETCTTKIFGLDIDFVNLRNEQYAEHSRIPKISSGTPTEDAYRRDATLNALFFNLSTMQIEDLTGSGLKDLSQGILRTPLEPRKTFLDDPLRCLRLIRFSSNYGFKVDSTTLASMNNKEIKIALDHKISRERIGVEFRKMILNKRGMIGVLQALELLRNVDFSCIFDLGDTNVDEQWYNDLTVQHHIASDILESIDNILKYLIPIINKDILPLKKIVNSDDDQIIFYLSLILNKWMDMKVKSGKKDNYVSFFCILNGIKMPLKLAESVSLITRNIERIQNDTLNFQNFQRSEISTNFVLAFKDKWELNLIVNCCLEIFHDFNSIDNILNKYKTLIDTIYQLKLDQSHNEQILLNGKEIMKLLHRKPGPWLKTISDQLFTWQLNNPTKGKDEMIEYLKYLTADD